MTFHFIESIKSNCETVTVKISLPNSTLKLYKDILFISEDNFNKVEIDEENDHKLFALTSAKTNSSRFNKMQFRDNQNREINFKYINTFITAFNSLYNKSDEGKLEVLHINDGKFLKTQIVVTVSDLDKFPITNENKNI